MKLGGAVPIRTDRLGGMGMDRIARLRTEYEDALLRIEGVVGVGIVVDAEGTPRLQVLTDVAADEVEPRLPAALLGEVVLLRVGRIDAQ